MLQFLIKKNIQVKKVLKINQTLVNKLYKDTIEDSQTLNYYELYCAFFKEEDTLGNFTHYYIYFNQ